MIYPFESLVFYRIKSTAGLPDGIPSLHPTTIAALSRRVSIRCSALDISAVIDLRAHLGTGSLDNMFSMRIIGVQL